MNLRDLIVPGPVERGLYFLEAADGAASRIQDRLVDLLWWDSVATPGLMPACLPAHLRPRNGSRGTHRRYSRIGSMIWIDTDDSFNRSSFMAQAHMRGMDSARAARAIRVQHPIGALSYLETLERIPNAALCALGDSEASEGPTAFSRQGEGGVRPSNSIWWTPLVVISDLMGPLLDESIPASDRVRISMHVLERLRHLRERAVVLALLPRTGDRFLTREFLQLGTLLRTEETSATQGRPVARELALSA
jgi:hypothetical protein